MDDDNFDNKPFDLHDEAIINEDDFNEYRPWKVYIHIIPKSVTLKDHDMYYVGVTSRKLSNRFGKNGNGYKKQYFYDIIQKYGWNNIEHEVIAENLTQQEASDFERKLIKILNTCDEEFGFNKDVGGGAYCFLTKEKIIGKQFGRLTVLSVDPNDSGKVICQCSCENKTIKSISRSNLLNGSAQSCGCIALEKLLSHSITHNMSKTKLYRIWLLFKYACQNENDDNYANYGARGIKFYKEWGDDFLNFYDWSMANGYDEKLNNKLDLIDKNKDFCPDNCRWITSSEKINQRNDVKLITYNGKTQNITQWERELGFKRGLIKNRLFKYHWSIEKAFETPSGNGRPGYQYEYNGEIHTITEWANILNLNRKILGYKINSLHEPIEQAIFEMKRGE